MAKVQKVVRGQKCVHLPPMVIVGQLFCQQLLRGLVAARNTKKRGPGTEPQIVKA